MINILILLNRSANMISIERYVENIHDENIKFTVINNNKLHKIKNNSYDMLIYQTFPVENHRKFNVPINTISDNYFLEFNGPKLLFDTHDDGNTDGFPRFNKSFDRIKTTVSYDKIDKLRVKYILGDPVFANSNITFNNKPKIELSYNVGYQDHGYGHFLRESTRDILLKNIYKKHIDMNKHKPFEEHIHNCRVLICPPGNCGHYEMYGIGIDTSKFKKVVGDEHLRSGISRRQLYALKQGALLLNYKSIKDLKLFNDYNLIENVDYMTYDLTNLNEKIDFCINNKDKIDKIRLNGFNKFRQAANLKKNSDSFAKFIEKYYNDNKIQFEVIMLILDSDDLPIYEYNRKIWREYMNSNDKILSLFIRYSPDIKEDAVLDINNNILFIKGKEEYSCESILNKTIKAFKYCHERFTYKYIVRTNVSGIWIFDNLLQYLSERQHGQYLTGWVVNKKINNKTIYFVSGSGIIIPNNLVPMLFDHTNFTYEMDDLEISTFYTNKGIRLMDSRRKLDTYVKKFEYNNKNDILSSFNNIKNDKIVYFRIKSTFDRYDNDKYCCNLIMDKYYRD